MKNKLGYTAFAALFFLLCLIPSVGMAIGAQAEGGGNEVLAALPALRDREGKLNTDYLTDLMDYAEDNYFLRPQFVNAWSALNHRVLGASIADNVLLGEDGWLYFADTLDDYTGTALWGDREVFSAARNLALMSEYCESRGARFLFTIAPNKNSLYPEHMPRLTVFSWSRSANALASALYEADVSYLDLFQLLEEQEETLYFTQDSHWNSKGAALAADGLNAALGRSSHYFAGPFAPLADQRSDLYDMLYPTGTWLEEDQKYVPELSFTYDAPVRDGNSMTITTTGGGEGSLLMFRDSFGILLYPYLADSFGSALFSRANPYRLNLVEERSADFVVVELVERNLDYLLQNVPQMPAPLREPPSPSRQLEGVDRPALSAEPSRELAGYVLVSGTLPAAPDSDSPVWLCTGSASYEAFLLEEGGFALYLPEEELTGALSLVFQSSGEAVSTPAAL